MLFLEKNHPKYIGLIALIGLSAVSVAQQSAEKDILDAAMSMPPVDCVVSPHKVIDLASAVPGVIEILKAERSDFVEKDQVVAMLASKVEQASVALAQQRAEIEAEVYLEQINLDFAQRQQKRIDMLYDTDAVSYQNKDDADREVELSTWKLQQARDLLNVRKLELNRAYQQLEQKTVRSPISGFVVQTFKSEGEYVEDQPVLRIAKLDPLNVDAIVPMDMFGKIEVGMTAKIRLET
ncbi:MAG: HlyD family efflux transporter periplasmic adaptor subunit, partial [Pseudomonadales bacterium]